MASGDYSFNDAIRYPRGWGQINTKEMQSFAFDYVDVDLLIGKQKKDMIEEVRKTWQFYRDRRPETYDKMLEI